MKDEFHSSLGFKYVTPEYVLRVKNIETYLNSNASLPKNENNPSLPVYGIKHV